LFIPVAKITRPHGFPREGRCVLKAELFQKGGELFRTRQSAFFKSPGAKDYVEIFFAAENSPAGGAWGQAKGLLLTFEEAKAPPLGSELALRRSDFPALPPGEFYLCDLMGLRVVDETGKVYGKVASFFENKSGQVSLRVEGEGKSFEFPLSWMDAKASRAEELFPLGEIIVPEVKEWL
jgi:hypothetical protein